MNVFLKDKFVCIGWSPWIHSGIPSYAQFVILEPLPVAPIHEDVPISSPCRYETYEIDDVYHAYKNQFPASKSLAWKVDPVKQDLSPLEIKPYCDVSWFIKRDN